MTRSQNRRLKALAYEITRICLLPLILARRTDRDVKLLLTCEPGLGRFFEEAGTPLAENKSGRANVSLEEIQRVLEIVERYGQRFPAPA